MRAADNMVNSLLRPTVSIMHRLVGDPAGWLVVMALGAITAAVNEVAPVVAKAAMDMPGVVHAVEYKYMCSDPGQTMLKDAIRDKKLDGVVVAACSPRMHEPTFRRTAEEGGINPYQCEMANIREHCSWVHEKGTPTTAKACPRLRASWKSRLAPRWVPSPPTVSGPEKSFSPSTVTLILSPSISPVTSTRMSSSFFVA